MIALKSIHASFSPNQHALFYPIRLSKTKIFVQASSKSNDSQPEGDTRNQELLARIAMLQAQKVRLTDYLDERSAYLTQFAEEANVEFDKIGEDALKGLDEAGARIMENIDNQMQAFEESAEINKEETEKNDDMLAEFESLIEKERNEGLFFQNLGQKVPVEKTDAKQEIEKINTVTKEHAGSKIRRNIYLALIGLLVIAIADSFTSSASDWRKVAILGAILMPLIFQFSYEQKMSYEKEKSGEEDK